MKNDVRETVISRMREVEYLLLATILQALAYEGLPDTFSSEGLDIGFNENSGIVYLTNEEDQAAFINEGNNKLEVFHTSPYEGVEGFLSEIINRRESLQDEDKEWLDEIIGLEDEEIDGND